MRKTVESKTTNTEYLRNMWDELHTASRNYLQLRKELEEMRAQLGKSAERIGLMRKLLALDAPITASSCSEG